jgi:hypothetical protein
MAIIGRRREVQYRLLTECFRCDAKSKLEDMQEEARKAGVPAARIDE